MTITQINIRFTLCTIAVVLICACIDIKSHRIPNRLVFPGIAAAVFYHSLVQGLGGFIFSLTGLLGGIGLLLIPFLFRWVGAGDAKFLGFIGTAWGWPSVFEIFILATLSGGILGLGIIIVNPQLLKHLLRNARFFFVNIFVSLKNFALLSIVTGSFGTTSIQTAEMNGDDTNVKNHLRIPYGVAIAMGAVIWLALNLSGHPINLMAS